MSSPSSAPQPTPPDYQPGLFALRLLVIVVGGWVLSTLLGIFLASGVGGPEGSIAITGLLNLAWLALILYELSRWRTAGRAKRSGPATGGVATPPRYGGWPVFGIASVAAPLLVWHLVNEAFYKPYTGPTGESGLIGFAAVGLLCALGLVAGLGAGIASLLMRERRWVGILGLVANIGTALMLTALMNRAANS